MAPKKSSSHDELSNKLLKEIYPVLLTPLTKLINISLETGFIPRQWKTAKIVPLFKSGKENNFNNYRPISLLPTFPKVLEKVVNFQLTRYNCT